MDINYRKSGYFHSLSNLNVNKDNNKILSNHPSLSNKNFTTIESSSHSFFPQSKSVSKLNYNRNTFDELNDMIEQCKINKKLGNNYYDPDKGYTSSRVNYLNKNNPFEVFKSTKDYLLTDTPLSSGRGERRVKMSYRNNSRLKDKINELIELTKEKKEKITENDKKNEGKNNTKNEISNNNTIESNEKERLTNKKSLSEQRKDIYNLLSEKSYFLSSFSPVKSKFKYKALEIEASPYIIRNHSKVNSFFNNNSSRATTIGTNESNILNTSSSCSKINLINKMIDMKLSNNHLYKKNSSNNNMFLLSYSNRNKNVINKKTENEYRIKNKIKDLTKFKFSNNYNARQNYRENEIKENNLQVISIIKNNIKDNINKAKLSKIGNHHKRSSTYEDIDIDIDKQIENNINKNDNVKKECK